MAGTGSFYRKVNAVDSTPTINDPESAAMVGLGCSPFLFRSIFRLHAYMPVAFENISEEIEYIAHAILPQIGP